MVDYQRHLNKVQKNKIELDKHKEPILKQLKKEIVVGSSASEIKNAKKNKDSVLITEAANTKDSNNTKVNKRNSNKISLSKNKIFVL